MTETRWDKVGALFERARTVPPERRSAFLQARCPDEAVRQEVASLLDAHAEASGFFKSLIDAVAPHALSDLHRAEAGPGAERDPLALTGTHVARYAVEEHLGSGGMGVVYRARDTRLGRTVALKFLPPHLGANAEAEERFVREAQSAAALDHPNIATIHEIGTTDVGRRFIAMAYYEGETLKARLTRGPLPVEEALGHAVPIAEALARAHEAGIVHRDVKPANIMLTARGEVKLLDFGLARVADQSQLTQSGRRMGTVAYMSPEQARGEAVDGRTDLWALGAVLYETLTGTRPFRGERETAILYAILHEAPAPLGTLRDDVPPALQAIVERCLEKDPERRYASAEALLDDLRAFRASVALPAASSSGSRTLPLLRRGWLVGAVAALLIFGIALGWVLWPGEAADEGSLAPAAGERSVAVLPFTSLGATDSTGYFSLGVTDEIRTRLAQVGGLSVISRTSVMPYQQTEKSLQEIANELGVAAVVEGSVQQAGERVRITAQLIDAETDRHLWGESYNRELEDIFAVQSDIAKAIAAELEAELAPGVAERIERAPTEDLAAYELFLRARARDPLSTKEENDARIGLLQQALARDPDFALARATLAKAYARDAWNYGADIERADSAVAEAERAIALAPDLAEARAALGFARMAAGRFSEAIASFEHALELNPNDWRAANDLAIVYLQTGRLAQAVRQWKRALKGDPANAHGYRFNLALAYRILGLLEQAEEANQAALALEPDHVLALVNQAHVDLFQGDTAAAMEAAERLAGDYGANPYALQSAGWIYLFAGAPERARAPLERAYALSPAASGEGYVRVRLGYVLWQAGERERAARLFEDFERFATEQIEKGNEYGMLPYALAAAHAVRGETDEAIRWLERAVELGWPYELTTLHDPLLTLIRDEERFQTLVERMRARNAAMRQQLAQAEEQEEAGRLPPGER